MVKKEVNKCKNCAYYGGGKCKMVSVACATDPEHKGWFRKVEDLVIADDRPLFEVPGRGLRWLDR